MKKIIVFVLSLLLFSINFEVTYAENESDFETNSAYYYQLCSGSNLSDADTKTCNEFSQYLSDKSSSLRDQLEKIEEERASIAKDIEKAASKIKDYNSQIATLASDITSLSNSIAAKEIEIVQKQAEIDAKEAEVNSLKQKIKDRMIKSQSSMRLNQLLDFIMGASDFEDLIRRTNGISAISSYDDSVRKSLNELIIQLGIDKEELLVIKQDLDDQKASLVEKQNDLIVKRREAEIVKQEYLKKEADLEASYGQIVGDLDGIKKLIAGLSEELDKIPSSSGFRRPISGGRISAGTWYYPSSFGGGVHLGVDYAAPKGTTVVAPANGVIILSVDGCGDGYLGNTCGGTGGGNSKGGNQMAMIVRVDGKTYAIKYYHLLINTVKPKGTTVSSGDKVAELGTSGNSTGPHVHTEVYYLGTMSITSYVASWSGDMAFGCGWGSQGLNRLCENGVGAPCRVKPESVFE